MFIATIIVSALLAAMLTMSAVGKLRRDPRQLDTMHTVRYPDDKLWLLAAAELAGAAGLIVGLFWWPIGVAAAIGAALYFIGAMTAHLRVGDRQIAPAGVLLIASIAALVLRLVTA